MLLMLMIISDSLDSPIILPIIVHHSFLQLRPSIWNHFLYARNISFGTLLVKICLSVFACLKMPIFHTHSWKTFAGYKILGWYIKAAMPLSSTFHCFGQKISCKSNYHSFTGILLPVSFLSLVLRSSLCLWYSVLLCCPSVGFIGFPGVSLPSY